MSQIDKYVLVGANDTEQDYEYASFDDAKAEAERLGMAVVERHYVYDDSELVWTPDGSDQWPPKRRVSRTK